jgi:hypothetical protein
MQSIIGDKLKEAGIQAKVESRIKRLYSIHKKLQRQRISVDQVYDLCAMRVITRSLQDCYAVLGIIHNIWRPVPGRIKDFIAMPRPNFYQSLHTSVITEDGTPFEIQIRTEEMHKMAEEGIAAHWKYKDGPVSAQDEQRLAWLRQVVEWQRDVSDPNEFLSTLKVDLYPEEVYTFTPKGKVVVLPREATPIDFAYTIHTEVGHTCVGAKVNGRMVPLRHKLHSGDIVEILTQPDTSPAATGWTGQVVALAQQDQALAQPSPARTRHRNRPQADRKRSAQIPHRAQRNQGRRTAEGRQRIRPGQGRRPDVRHRLRKIFRAPGARPPACPRAATPSMPATSKPKGLSNARRDRQRRPPRVRRPQRHHGQAARATCWSTAPAVVIPSAAKASSATSRAARASRCTPPTAPTSPT